MTLIATLGQAQTLEGREAGGQAARKALNQLKRIPPALGLVIASHDYPIQQVLAGVEGILGNIPLWGFSTSGELTASGQGRRTILVVLLAGEGVQAHADWWPGFTENSRACAQKMIQALRPEAQEDSILLLAAEGLNGDAAQLCAELSQGTYPLAGCLAGGDLYRGLTDQIGGRQSGTGGLAAALLRGNLIIGVGLGHGWRDVGRFARVTKAKGAWVRTLDGQKASEAYADLYGYPARDWAFPPLNSLVRLYPLGLEGEGGTTGPALRVRAPLRVEVDGSLRMNTAVRQGEIGHFLVGSAESCLAAAKQATQQALEAIGTARPALALLLVDVAWQMLLEAQPGSEAQAVRAVLGPEVPIAGGYTYGQIARPEAGKAPELLNQHIQVVIFAEPEEA